MNADLFPLKYPRVTSKKRLFSGFAKTARKRKVAGCESRRPNCCSPYRQILSKHVRSYCEETTLHGVRYIMEPKRQSAEKWLWCAVCLTCVSVALAMMKLVWSRFQESPTVTTVETTNYPIWNIPFPAVTLCNNNIVYKPAALALAAKLSKELQLSESSLLNFFQKLSELVVPKSKNFTDEDRIQELILNAGYTIPDLMLQLATPCEKMVLQCRWLDQKRACSDIIFVSKSVKGFCCSFNYHGVRDELRVSETTEKLDTNEIHYISGAGRRAGLSLTLNIDQGSYFSTVRSIYGIDVLFHDPMDYPETSLQTAVVQPSQSVTMAMGAQAIESAPEVRILGESQRQCWFDDEVAVLHSADEYSYQTCITECRMEVLAEKCGCIPYYYPLFNKTARVCTLLDSGCLRLYRRVTAGLQPEKTDPEFGYDRRSGSTMGMNCSCLPQCTDKSYLIATEVVNLAYEFASPGSSLLQYSNISQLHVNFREFTCMKYLRNAYMTWDAVFATFGGIFGLCMGGSIISLFELVYRIALMLGAAVRALLRPRTLQSRENIIIPWNAQETNVHFRFHHKKKSSGLFKTWNVNWNKHVFPRHRKRKGLKKEKLDKFTKILSSHVLRYCDETTLHGIRYIAEKKKIVAERILWAVVCVVCATVAYLMMKLVWNRFQHSPTVTTVETTNYPIWNIPFPGVTLCNNNKVYRTAALSLIANMTSLFAIDSDVLQDFLKKLPSLIQPTKISTKNVETVQNLLLRMGYNLSELMVKLAPPCESMVLACMWLDKEENCSSMFYISKSSYGVCCSFNYQGVKPQFRVGKEAPPGVVHHVTGAGSHAGLKVYLDIEKEEYFSPLYPMYGISVLFHDPLDYPETSLRTALVEPSQLVTVSLDAEAIESVNDVRLISVKQRQCWFDDEVSVVNSAPEYSYQTCVSECRIDVILKRCNCTPFFYPQYNADSRECTLLDVACINKISRIIAGFHPSDDTPEFSSSSDEMDVELSVGMNCSCLPQCTDKSYLLKSEVAQLYPHLAHPDSLLNRKKSSSISILQVFFADITCIKYSRDAYMTWDAMFATFGGIFGLCMGGSVISLFEIGYRLVLLMCATGKALFVRNPERNSKVNISSVSNKLVTPNPQNLNTFPRKTPVKPVY